MELRPYQQDAIRGVYREMRAGRTRVVLVIPTGGGKTRIGADVVRQGVEAGRRIIWLVHRRELVDQAAATLHQLGLEVGVIAAGSSWPVRPDAPVHVASVQTLVARESIRPAANLLVWDECHHAGEAAAEWIRVLDAYPGTPMLGLTATPERADGTGLAPIFNGLVVGVTARQLTAQGHLVPCEVVRPSTWLKANRQSGNPLAQDPVEAYLQHAPGRQGFLFAASVEEAESFATRFCASGIRAAAVSAKTPDEERALTLRGFRDGLIRVLCNVFVFTEGTDMPAASVCILARNAGTAGTFLQMVGRVLRPAPGKKNAVLLDLPGLTHVHGCPEDERHWRLKGRACVLANQRCRVCGTAIEEYPCPSCGIGAPEAEDRGNPHTEITNDPLVKYARKIAESPEQRRETAIRWIRAALLKGHNPKSIMYKWKAVYQDPMPRDLYIEALRAAEDQS